MTELMPGVEVLAVENFSYLNDGGVFLMIFGIIIILVSLLLGIFFILEDDNPILLAFIPIGILLIMIGQHSDTTDYTQYQVLINENVSLIEFNEKYEIIEQNGKIYTIQEINTN